MLFTCKPAQHTFICSPFSIGYRLLVTLILMLALFITTPVFSANFQQGYDAAIKGGFVIALEQWRPLAKQGDTIAQYNLGNMYAKGQGVPQDYKMAIKWYRLAVEQDYVLAQYNLGVMYDFGRGVPQDYKIAAKWYRLAAEQDYVLAQDNIGIMYANGQGVLQDYVRAHMWFNIAASNGADSKNRDLMSKKMTPSQLEEAQNLAREWVIKHGD